MNRSSSAQIEHDAAAWLARRDAGDWADQQQATFETWLAEDTAHRVAFLRLEAVWTETERLKTFAAGGAHDRVPARGEWAQSPYFAATADRAQAALRRSVSRPRMRRWPVLISVAASLLVIVGIAGGLLWWQSFGQVEHGSWRTALGARQVVHLTDGSTATLGSDTELRVALSRHERNLYLSRGEAFFDVAKDHARPFVVHAHDYRVIAVGTRFDVRRDDDGMRVVVTRGVVRLQSVRDPGQAAAELPAGSIAMVTGNNLVVQHVPLAQAVQYLRWRDGYVVFHDTPLADAIQEFNRNNARKIVLADPSLDALRVGGNFRLDNSGAFVRLVQEVFPIRAEEHGDRIVLSRRHAKAQAPK